MFPFILIMIQAILRLTFSSNCFPQPCAPVLGREANVAGHGRVEGLEPNPVVIRHHTSSLIQLEGKLDLFVCLFFYTLVRRPISLLEIPFEIIFYLKYYVTLCTCFIMSHLYISHIFMGKDKILK